MDDINISFKVEDMSPQVLAELDKAVKRALYNAGIDIQRGATESLKKLVYDKTEEQQKEEKKREKEGIKVYKRTGRLLASVSFITPTQKSPAQKGKKPKNIKASDKLSGSAPANTLIFGTNVEYAVYVHEGTRKMAGRPFLRNGVDAVKNDIKDTIDRIFRGEL